ncbi:MAG TPA: hypothetical protein VL335_03465 [Candidatus Paceibacterota bacterium]|nr:hypothetical protein [Candidatus Paceibacterota bacterium]
MTPEEKSLLERTYKLVEENNDILIKMRRGARITNIMRIVYWAVILIVSFGAYYFIQPYLNFMLGSLGSLSGLVGNANAASDAAQSLKDLISPR